MTLFKLPTTKKQGVKANQKISAGQTNALDRSLRSKMYMYDLRMNNKSQMNVLDTSLRAKMYDLRMNNLGMSNKETGNTSKNKGDVRKKSSASPGMYMTSDFMAYGLTKWKQSKFRE